MFSEDFLYFAALTIVQRVMAEKGPDWGARLFCERLEYVYYRMSQQEQRIAILFCQGQIS